jgi:hypothetical protein
MATRYWDSTGSTDLNDGSNYTGSGTLLTTDDLIFDSTSMVNAIATNDLSVRTLSSMGDYTGEMNFSGRQITLGSGCYLNHTGNLTCPDKITSSDGTVRFGSNLATVSRDNACHIRFDTTNPMAFATYKVLHFRQFTFANGAHVTNASENSMGLNLDEATYPPTGAGLNFEGDGTFTVDRYIHLYRRYNGELVHYDSTSKPYINGTAALRWTAFYAAPGTVIDFPGVNYGGSGYYEFTNESSNDATVQMTGKVDVGVQSFRPFMSGQNVGKNMTFDLNDRDLTCGELWAGCFGNNNLMIMRYGNGYHRFTQYRNNLYNDGTTLEYYEGSSMVCPGYWTVGNKHTIYPGTSTVTMTGTGTITGGVFNRLVINTAGTITLGSDATCNSYQKIAGTFNLNGYKLFINFPPQVAFIYSDG